MADNRQYNKTVERDIVNALSDIYKVGTVVEAENVRGVDVGICGVVKNVRLNGDIHVAWENGKSSNVVLGQDVIRIFKESCQIDRKATRGGCDGDKCIRCGWNKVVASRRVWLVRHGGLVKGKNGISYLRLKREKEDEDGDKKE